MPVTKSKIKSLSLALALAASSAAALVACTSTSAGSRVKGDGNDGTGDSSNMSHEEWLSKASQALRNGADVTDEELVRFGSRDDQASREEFVLVRHALQVGQADARGRPVVRGVGAPVDVDEQGNGHAHGLARQVRFSRDHGFGSSCHTAQPWSRLQRLERQRNPPDQV